MIEAIDISKSFGDNHVLKDISITFEKGKTNLIIGQSGSGKTVLMKCLVGLFDVDAGKVEYDGRNISDMTFKQKKDIRKELGMLFQGSALFDSMTVEQNVMFPLNMFSNMSAKEKLSRVNSCLERVDLHKVNKLLPSELSGGMKKRVAIARAISMNPEYLFCDEPNSGLDPLTSGLIDELIDELTKEYQMTTIVNTHDMNSVLNVGDSIAFIYKGELGWRGSKEEILHTDNQPLNDFVFGTELTKRLKKTDEHS
ncbi:MAG: ATP-binding cassette domain-containing protein [Bacteroidales bacterium]|nr:ATP-binding cassette domain-containing protein [Bacteroidales bacterium]MCF8343165.1 ATP-binding cassette domain-containing protein [Bacteroidales bacterium]MCF8350658.1 ATP-binding cassette domain-containing protein [Bacteroidales bacterium]MCF8376824.1 ATP-binding cassette domain-containing protein [Bacteroidales bacterium]MCF8400731.1 ATP-binding cassette domain-containing protein [Bacteroidales bacterium]